MDRWGLFPPVAGDKNQVAGIDQETGGLTDGKDDVPAHQGVDQQQTAPAETEIPEGGWNETAAVPFRMEPLDEKPQEKQNLSGKTYPEYESMALIHGVF
jgi:hypothetical protein